METAHTAADRRGSPGMLPKPGTGNANRIDR